MSKGYIIVFVKMTNKEDFMGNYASKVADIFAQFDGKFIVRTPSVSHHEGRQFDLHVIAEFPSLKKATEALESPGYKAILPHRKKNSNVEYGSFMLVPGL
jgi:uncharacterized protein (DUF1330 family)